MSLAFHQATDLMASDFEDEFLHRADERHEHHHMPLSTTKRSADPKSTFQTTMMESKSRHTDGEKKKKKKKKHKKSSKSIETPTSSFGSTSLQGSNYTKTTLSSTRSGSYVQSSGDACINASGDTFFTSSSDDFVSASGEDFDIHHAAWGFDQGRPLDGITKGSDRGGFIQGEGSWGRNNQSAVSDLSFDHGNEFSKSDRQEQLKPPPPAVRESIASQPIRKSAPKNLSDTPKPASAISRSGRTGGARQLPLQQDRTSRRRQVLDRTSSTHNENSRGARRRAYLTSSVAESASPDALRGEDEDEPDPLVTYLVSVGFDRNDAQRVSTTFVDEQNAQDDVQRNRISEKLGLGSIDETYANPARQKVRNLHSLLPDQEARITPQLRSYQSSLQSGNVDIEAGVLDSPIRREVEPDLLPDEWGMTATKTPEAILVKDGSDEQLIVYADSGPLSLMHVLKDRYFRRCLILGILILVAVVSTTTIVLLRRGGGGGTGEDTTLNLEPTMSPSFSPTYISDVVLNAAAEISGWDAFNQTNSPQMKAVGWISTHDEQPVDDLFAQRYALAVFFFSTNGLNWMNPQSWLDPTLHECDWSEGISCFTGGSNNYIVNGLDETRNGLSGSLPAELGMLTEITSLRISKNNIGGPIPDVIGKLSRMETLDLSSNNITGSIPDTIGEATNLMELSLGYCVISGSIPSSLYNLLQLRKLDLSWNQITGPIEEDVSNLKNMVSFDVRHNQLAGTITSGFDEMKAADFIWMDYNKFSGGLPALSEVMASRLEMSFSHNDLTGEVPVADVVRRRLYVEESFRFRIQKIDLSYNRLSGTINPVSAFLPSLRYLDFSGNQFSGQFPGDYGWSGLEYLAIANNNFSGTLPSGWPQSLSHLDVRNNSMSGGIPTRLCTFPGLKLLGLGNNLNLTGNIPSCLFQLPVLQNLDLASIKLEGTIPADVGLLTQLEYLDVSGNSLIGTIPDQIGQCSNLAAINLSKNKLVGVIPSDIGQLQFLKSLNISDNNLSGSLPTELGNLQKIEMLSLRGNNLSGSLPNELCFAEKNWSSADIGCSIKCNCCVNVWIDPC